MKLIRKTHTSLGAVEHWLSDARRVDQIGLEGQQNGGGCEAEPEKVKSKQEPHLNDFSDE